MYRFSLRAIVAALVLAASAPAMAQDNAGISHSAPPGATSEQPDSSVRDIYRQEHAYFGDKFTIVERIEYSHSDRNQLSLSGFLVLDAIFLGNISVDEVTYDTLEASLSFRYDLTDRLQIQTTVPYLVRRAHFESTGQKGGSTAPSEATVYDQGIGDVTAAVYYHALQERAGRPDLVLYAGFRAPTGDDPFGVSTVSTAGGTLEYPSELPMGNGVWSAFTGVSLIKTYDPAILFASIGYEHTFVESFDDISSFDGNQPGEVDLGDIYRFGMGIAFALNRQLSLSLSYSHAITTEAQQTPQGGVTTGIIGSQGSAGALNLGMTLALGDSSSLIANIAVGVTEDAPDISLSFSVPFSP